jgi:hypothetical protein
MRHSLKVSILAMCLGTASAAFADEPNYGSSTLSPAEIKALIDERADAGESSKEMYIECCGIDVDKKTARVMNSMLAQRDAQLKEMLEHYKDYNLWRGYRRFLDECKTNPKVLVDVAVVIDQQTNGIPTDQTFTGLANACGNPPNATYAKFLQKVKVVHFKLLPDMTKRPRQGYVLKLDEKTGELSVYTFNSGAMNIEEATKEWVEKQ